MKNVYFLNKKKILLIAVSIAVLSIIVRLLIEYRFDKSALLYVGIPFLVSLILIKIRNPTEQISWKRRYANRLIDAFIIMLGSSVVLFEGFLCVVMFMPIYLVIILIMFLIEASNEHLKKRDRSTFGIHILPFLIVISSFEGISADLSHDRNEVVTVSRVVQMSVADIKHNLIKPIDLNKQRPWFLELFPMPYAIKAESLQPGDVHEINFRYYRWFVSNVHEGKMLLEISEVDETRVKTTFLDDTSYIGHYMQLTGTEILLDKIDDNKTKITLTINFKRTLDPYWYFAPLERYGVSKAADFLIAEIIARDAG